MSRRCGETGKCQQRSASRRSTRRAPRRCFGTMTPKSLRAVKACHGRKVPKFRISCLRDAAAAPDVQLIPLLQAVRSVRGLPGRPRHRPIPCSPTRQRPRPAQAQPELPYIPIAWHEGASEVFPLPSAARASTPTAPRPGASPKPPGACRFDGGPYGASRVGDPARRDRRPTQPKRATPAL
jgi:hypothetical protein